METVWNKVKAALQERISESIYRMWIEPLKLRQGRKGIWVVACPNPFYKKRVQDKYGTMIESALQAALKKPCQIEFHVSKKIDHFKPEKNYDLQLPLANDYVNPGCGCQLRKDFIFDYFVVGDNNDFAYSASLLLASQKNTHHKSLLLLSNTGMGKSHLSQAIGHHILSEYPNARVYYVGAEDFSNEMVQAFRHGAIDKFKGKYKNSCDVLLLEDVHYLSGKERTQIELASILDALHRDGKRIIFSSCYLPANIPKLHDSLRSRLSNGLISNIDLPNFRTRFRILQKKAVINGYKIPPDVLQYLAGELTEDVRQLESGLNGVAARSSLLGEPIDQSLAESVVKYIVQQRKNITIEAIKKLVCQHYHVSAEDIGSRSRKQSLVRSRQLAIYLSRRYTDVSLQAIGKSFKRNHATALHSINSIERGLKQSSTIQKQVQFLSQKLESGNF